MKGIWVSGSYLIGKDKLFWVIHSRGRDLFEGLKSKVLGIAEVKVLRRGGFLGGYFAFGTIYELGVQRNVA